MLRICGSVTTLCCKPGAELKQGIEQKLNNQENDQEERDEDDSHGANVVPIQGFVYVRVSIYVSAIQSPVNHCEHYIKRNIGNRVYSMVQTNRNPTDHCFDKQENKVQNVLCYVREVHWFAIEDHQPISNCNHQANGGGNVVKPPEEFMMGR